MRWIARLATVGAARARHVFGVEDSMHERGSAQWFLVTAIGLVALAGGLLPVSPTMAAARPGCTAAVGVPGVDASCSFTSKSDTIRYNARKVKGQFFMTATITVHVGPCSIESPILQTVTISSPGPGTFTVPSGTQPNHCVVVSAAGTAEGAQGEITVLSP